jgi:AcrR family transcriptional regulator
MKADRYDLRERIIKAAIQLLKKSGRDALTTRGVADAAEIQAPTLYRLFGDKRSLLDAVAEYGYIAAFNKKHEYKPGPDPVDNLRKVWDLNTDFGLENPVLYSLMFGDPRPGFVPPAVEKSRQLLSEFIRAIAIVGRLRLPEERAAELVVSTSKGVVLSLLAKPEDRRDSSLAKDAREAVIAAITHDAPHLGKPGAETAAIALQASLPTVKSLTDGERLLLKELLERIATRG